jgi:hypothetical protein
VRVHGKDSHQALSANRKERSGSPPAGASDRSKVRGSPCATNTPCSMRCGTV